MQRTSLFVPRWLRAARLLALGLVLVGLALLPMTAMAIADKDGQTGHADKL